MSDPFYRPTENLRDLQALEEIEKNPNISQRELSKKLGVAVGMANACLHALVRKGLVKVRGQSNRSITYHVTHKGVLHKAKLAAQWSWNTIDFYRQARKRILDQLSGLGAQGHERLVLFGWSEAAEIAIVVAQEAGVKIIGIVEPGQGDLTQKLGIPLGEPTTILGLDGESPVLIARALGENDEVLVEAIGQSRPVFFLA